MLVKSKKDKGRRAEVAWTQKLKDRDIAAHRTIGSGKGIEKGDISADMPILWEVKNQEKLNVWQAINQARLAAEKTHLHYGVAFMKNGESFQVVLDADVFLDIYQRSRAPQDISQTNKEFRFWLSRFLQAGKRINSLLEQ